MPNPNSNPDYILDLTSAPSAAESLTASAQPADSGAASAAKSRPFLSVHWKCCQTYSRIYRNTAKTAYKGHCPTCGKSVTATIAEGGVNSRFFTAY